MYFILQVKSYILTIIKTSVLFQKVPKEEYIFNNSVK
jgi:hypothetical protein